MRIVVFAKEVRDPDAVDNYALEGRLEIGEDGKTLTQKSIPRIMNAYDEQAIEAALRLRDGGTEVELVVVSVGAENHDLLKHAASLGANEIVDIKTGGTELDYHAVARVLAAWLETSGNADLVLCGRQASDDDQGVVPSLVAEHLGLPVVTIAREVALTDGGVRITRVTPDGDEVVEAATPAVVTVSNELGEPRYPTMRDKMKARRMEVAEVSVDDLGLAAADLAAKVTLTKQYVPVVRGDCEMIDGASAGEMADKLVARLRGENLL